ncbi:EamA family transporter RarD [Gryllotalpicola ginsengisoli]|uniref:EamA family transporter RarD n=1 Tax=Gryllotalpicola ginsengisoli TaxID=444608 RepID=UPI0003B62DC8|nr:EamA family transporter RarD [Gryllotalpicola ginsengisoli]
MPDHDTAHRSGLIHGVLAYLLWGLLPVYFLLLAPAGAVEVVAWRILFSLVFCAIALTATHGWRTLGAARRSPRLVFTMGAAGLLIFINWTVYIFATLSGHVVEAALGYFINPVVTVFLGVIVLRERLRVLQWVAVGISIVAIGVLTFAYGRFPWIALTLAFSFGLYGLVKNRVGRSIGALSGLALETAWLSPVAAVELIVLGVSGASGGVTFAAHGAGHALLLMAAGVVTAVPLLLYAAAARRLPLVDLGLIQYLTPILQFLVGVVLLHERMQPERWVGFALVWAALLLLVADLIATTRRPGARRVTRP